MQYGPVRIRELPGNQLQHSGRKRSLYSQLRWLTIFQLVQNHLFYGGNLIGESELAPEARKRLPLV